MLEALSVYLVRGPFSASDPGSSAALTSVSEHAKIVAARIIFFVAMVLIAPLCK